VICDAERRVSALRGERESRSGDESTDGQTERRNIFESLRSAEIRGGRDFASL